MMEQTREQRETGKNFVLLKCGADTGTRIGIYAKGSCDLKLLYACAPLIRPVLHGACCIVNEGDVSDSRSDILLQTLQSHPKERLEQISTKLSLPADYFLPRLFERTFTVPGADGPEEFPKSVVCLSTG